MKTTLDLLEMNIENGKNPSVGHESSQSDSYLLRSEMMKLPPSVLGYFVNDECHLVPLEGDALVMDTVKEPMKEMSRVPETRECTGASQLQSPSVVVSARFKVTDSGDFRGQIGSRRKPIDNDPDVLFRTQQNLALWRPVKYRRFVTGDAFECRIPLLYPYEDSEFADQTDIGRRQEDYTSSLLSSLAPAPTNPARVEHAKQPTLEEIIQTLMLKVHVIRFNKLVGCVRERFHDSHQVTNAAVLHHVQKVAVLVRGWWVVKSELLYQNTTHRENGIVSNTLLIRARDYILAVFHRGEHLTRKTISSMTKLPALEATEILQQVARRMDTTQKGHVNHWEFNQVDQEFVRRYPDVVQQQHSAWEARIRQLCGQLKLERLVSDGARRRRRCSGRLSSESDSETDVEFRSLVSGVLLSPSALGQRKRQLSLSHTSNNENASDSPSTHQPRRKRTRTQSLSSTSTAFLLSPPPPRILSPPPQLSQSLRFVPESTYANNTSAPSYPLPNSSLVTQRIPSSPSDQIPVGTAPLLTVMLKEPPDRSSDLVIPHTPSIIAHPSVSLCKPEPSDPLHTADANSHFTFPITVVKQEPPADNIPPMESYSSHVVTYDGSSGTNVSTALLLLVREQLRCQPIVSLSELAKLVQQSLGNSIKLNCSEPPPPGSETERESLKPHILEALLQADARPLKLVWPTDKDAKPEEMLFTSKVAGSECGVISEETHRLRDLVLDACEKQPFFKLKDLYDRLDELRVPKPSRKIMCSVLKHYCVYRHNRYYLRHTLFDS